MTGEDAERLTELLAPVLGDWLYWPANACPAGHDNVDPEYGWQAQIGDVCVDCAAAAYERELPVLPVDRAGGRPSEEAMAMFNEQEVGRWHQQLTHPDAAWCIGRGGAKDLDDSDLLWAAWGRWLAAVVADAPTMEVYWSKNTSRWVGAWPEPPHHNYQHFYGDTPATAFRVAWTAWLEEHEASLTRQAIGTS